MKEEKQLYLAIVLAPPSFPSLLVRSVLQATKSWAGPGNEAKVLIKHTPQATYSRAQPCIIPQSGKGQ